MTMNQDEFDKTLQLQLDTIQKIIESRLHDQETIDKTIKGLQSLILNIDQRSRALSESVPKAIRDSAMETANVISKQVLNKFEETNLSADRARAAYEKAVSYFGLKLFALSIIGFLAIFAGVWLLCVPSTETIASLYAEKLELEKNIHLMESKGALAVLTTCTTAAGNSPLCFRTDESDPKINWGTNGETYRLVWQRKSKR